MSTVYVSFFVDGRAIQGSRVSYPGGNNLLIKKARYKEDNATYRCQATNPDTGKTLMAEAKVEVIGKFNLDHIYLSLSVSLWQRKNFVLQYSKLKVLLVVLFGDYQQSVSNCGCPELNFVHPYAEQNINFSCNIV